jgi:hypothetical protein
VMADPFTQHLAGDPDQAEPTIDTDNVIHVIIPASAPGVISSYADRCKTER